MKELLKKAQLKKWAGKIKSQILGRLPREILSHFERDSKLEKFFYEAKPGIIIIIAALILTQTKWGFLSLAISLSFLYYGNALIFLRYRFRRTGSK